MSDYKQTMLSTTDNPFDPFKQYDQWLAFDEEKGYYSNAYLARILKTSEELSINDQARDIEAAIDEIVLFNVLGIYKKVTSE